MDFRSTSRRSGLTSQTLPAEPGPAAVSFVLYLLGLACYGYGAPDVASAAKWSAIWEHCEYASDLLVFLGCVGEYVAEYTKWRTEEARHSLGRQSLVVLILGLGFGLFSLIKTNALAGLIIASLGKQVEQAGEKVERVSASLESALSKSTQAETASAAALTKSAKAQTSASDAMTLASGARQEADSFEKDIVSAKAAATSAESHLAEALLKAANAEAEAARIKQAALPRRLSEREKVELVRLLSQVPAFTVVFANTRNLSDEVLDFTDDFIDVFVRMKLLPADTSSRKLNRSIAASEGRGVIIGVMSQAQHPQAADVLIRALRGWGFEATGEAAPIIKSATEMQILIGAKQ